MPQLGNSVPFREPVIPEGWAQLYCPPERDESSLVVHRGSTRCERSTPRTATTTARDGDR
jgi:hypothetical protein